LCRIAANHRHGLLGTAIRGWDGIQDELAAAGRQKRFLAAAKRHNDDGAAR